MPDLPKGIPGISQSIKIDKNSELQKFAEVPKCKPTNELSDANYMVINFILNISDEFFNLHCLLFKSA